MFRIPPAENGSATPAANVMVDVISGQQLAELGPGYAVATDVAFYVCLDYSITSGRASDLWRVQRVEYGEVGKIQLVQGTIGIWDHSDNLICGLAVPYSLEAATIFRRLSEATRGLPDDRRIMAESAGDL